MYQLDFGVCVSNGVYVIRSVTRLRFAKRQPRRKESSVADGETNKLGHSLKQGAKMRFTRVLGYQSWDTAAFLFNSQSRNFRVSSVESTSVTGCDIFFEFVLKLTSLIFRKILNQ